MILMILISVNSVMFYCIVTHNYFRLLRYLKNCDIDIETNRS